MKQKLMYEFFEKAYLPSTNWQAVKIYRHQRNNMVSMDPCN